MSQDMSEGTALRYQLDENVPIDDVRSATEDIWREIQQSGELEKLAREKGVALETLSESTPPVRYERKGGGTGAEVVTLLVIPIAIPIAKDIWKELILPKLKKWFGEGSIKQK